jgi:hypothetical protein
MSPRRRDLFQRLGGAGWHNPARTLTALRCGVLLLALAARAGAFTVTILPGTQEIYLQVGNGSFTGLFDAGGTPGNNTTINKVSVTVATAAVGTGAPQGMTTDSTASISFWDGFAFCNLPAQLYIGGFYRTLLANGATGTVTATVPTALTDGSGDTIAFSQISWTSGGNADTGAEPFPAGTFNPGAVQTVGTIADNQWAESCWTFSYANAAVPAAGTYSGRVIYTLTAP